MVKWNLKDLEFANNLLGEWIHEWYLVDEHDHHLPYWKDERCLDENPYDNPESEVVAEAVVGPAPRGGEDAKRVRHRK